MSRYKTFFPESDPDSSATGISGAPPPKPPAPTSPLSDPSAEMKTEGTQEVNASLPDSVHSSDFQVANSLPSVVDEVPANARQLRSLLLGLGVVTDSEWRMVVTGSEDSPPGALLFRLQNATRDRGDEDEPLVTAFQNQLIMGGSASSLRID